MRLIKYYRLMANLSQAELAEKANVSQAIISYLENGIIKCGTPAFHAIAEALAFPLKPMQLIDFCSINEWEKTA